ncbi:MAG: hypothetical protein ACN6PY_07410, partial [Paraburkholderia nemoris]
RDAPGVDDGEEDADQPQVEIGELGEHTAGYIATNQCEVYSVRILTCGKLLKNRDSPGKVRFFY